MSPWFLLAAAAGCAMPLHADIIYYSQPTIAYTSSTTLLPILDPEGSIVTSESDGNLTISFVSGGSPLLMDVDAVPDSWATWGSPPNTESSTPMVLTPDDGMTSSVLLQFSSLVTAFGMELEPNDTSSAHDIDVTFLLSGATQAQTDLPVDGDGGAQLFAASGGLFDSVLVSSDVPFGAAEFRYGLPTQEVPEPGSWWLAISAVAAALLWRRRRAHQATSSAK